MFVVTYWVSWSGDFDDPYFHAIYTDRSEAEQAAANLIENLVKSGISRYDIDVDIEVP